MSARVGLLAAGLLLTAQSAAAPFAWITNQGDDSVSVVDTATATVVNTVSVGHYTGLCQQS